MKIHEKNEKFRLNKVYLMVRKVYLIFCSDFPIVLPLTKVKILIFILLILTVQLLSISYYLKN